ncbi:MAG: acyl-CoA desaturase [Acidimicrobiales bacterium]
MSVLERPTPFLEDFAPEDLALEDLGALTVEDVASFRPSGVELRRATRRLRGKAVVIAALVLGSYVGLVFVASGPLLALPLAAILVVALIATATSVMHDANHGAFGRSRSLNQTLAYSADVLGASSWLWRHKHNLLHHGNTNVVGIDTDIEQMPFARLAPGQPWRPWYRYQYIYIWALYGFLTIQWMLLSDVACLITRRIGSQPMRRQPRRRDVALLFAGKVLHVGWAIALPFAFHRWWTVLAFYFACSWLVGFVLAVFFQLAHAVDTTEFALPSTPRRGDDFAAHQLHTTANVSCRTPVIGRPTAWLMGGLQHQIEHHLAPGLPHTSYPAMADRVHRVCSDRAVEYHVHPNIWAALRSHTRWLRAMGRPANSEEHRRARIGG